MTTRRGLFAGLTALFATLGVARNTENIARYRFCQRKVRYQYDVGNDQWQLVTSPSMIDPEGGLWVRVGPARKEDLAEEVVGSRYAEYGRTYEACADGTRRVVA